MPSPLGGHRLESTTVVTNAQTDTLFQHLERYPDLFRMTMPDTITYGFLNDAQQVQRLFSRYGVRRTILDRESHTRGLVLRQRCQHVLQHHRQVLSLEQVGTQPGNEVPDFLHDKVQLHNGLVEWCAGFFAVPRRKHRFGGLEGEAHSKERLQDAIVQFLTDPLALLK